MKHLSGFLYVTAGLACDVVFGVMVGAVFAATTPMYSFAGFVRTPIICLGPSLLVLTGVAIIVGGTRRFTEYVVTSIVILIGLTAWSVPKIGWQSTAWLFLYPEAASLLGAVVLLLLLRKLWVAALLGTLLSSPFFAYTAVILFRAYMHGAPANRLEYVSIAVPLALLVASLFTSLSAQTA